MKKNFKTIGIIGGMGPAASVFFAEKLITENKNAKGDNDHPPFLLYSNSRIPSRIEALQGNGESPVEKMITTCNILQTSGADFGVIICNTAHAFFSQVQKQTSLPLLHLIEETAKYVSVTDPHLKKIGLIATTPTAESRLYHNVFAQYGITIVAPIKREQTMIHEAIVGEHGIKAKGKDIPTYMHKRLMRTIKTIAHDENVTHVINGCTEFSLLFGEEKRDGLQFIDPVSICARLCLVKAGVEMNI